MVDFIHCLADLSFFDIRLLYHINLNSSIIYLFSGHVYPSFGISVLFFASSKLLYKYFFETSVFSSLILLPIKSPVASAVF